MENEIQHSQRMDRINAQNTTRKTRPLLTLGKKESRLPSYPCGCLFVFFGGHSAGGVGIVTGGGCMWYPYMRCSIPSDKIELCFNVSRGAGGSYFSDFSVIEHLFQGAFDEGNTDIRASCQDVSFADFT